MTAFRNRPAGAEAAALLVAAVGIIVQIIAGVPYPAVPPGLIILIVAAALVLFVPWRWAPVFGIVAGAFILIGGLVAPLGRHDLTHPGQVTVFTGTVLQMGALGVAVILGIAALGGSGRLARAEG